MRYWQVCDTTGVLITQRSMRLCHCKEHVPELLRSGIVLHTHAEWDCFVIRTGLCCQFCA